MSNPVKPIVTAPVSTPFTSGEWPVEELERVPFCPVCGTTGRTILYSNLEDRVFFCAPGSWTLYKCDGCSSAYLNPRPTAQSISRAYTKYYTHSAISVKGEESESKRFNHLRKIFKNGYLNSQYGYSAEPSSFFGPVVFSFLREHRSRADRWVRHLSYPKDNASLLDIGCANGSFLLTMRELGWKVQGLDIDPEAISHARQAGIPVEEGVLTDKTFPPSSFDAITMNHVIEHLHDPCKVLQICYELLRPGGYMWIATPNMDAEGHRVFGINWLGLDPPRHLVLFTLQSLKDLLTRIGFKEATPSMTFGVAEPIFAHSYTMQQGRDPFRDLLDLPRNFRQIAKRADATASSKPQFSEELIVLARK